jgi:diguanylate cyclase (GGDEF)-like protein
MVRAERTGRHFAVAFIDVDGLKATNDSLGHEAGDRLLLHVVQCLRENLRAYDVVVRFGGDEFICGLADMSLEEARTRFERINADLWSLDGSSVTVGLAELEPNDSLASLIARADEALYEERLRRTTGP